MKSFWYAFTVLFIIIPLAGVITGTIANML